MSVLHLRLKISLRKSSLRQLQTRRKRKARRRRPSHQLLKLPMSVLHLMLKISLRKSSLRRPQTRRKRRARRRRPSHQLLVLPKKLPKKQTLLKLKWQKSPEKRLLHQVKPSLLFLLQRKAPLGQKLQSSQRRRQLRVIMYKNPQSQKWKRKKQDVGKPWMIILQVIVKK